MEESQATVHSTATGQVVVACPAQQVERAKGSKPESTAAPASSFLLWMMSNLLVKPTCDFPQFIWAVVFITLAEKRNYSIF